MRRPTAALVLVAFSTAVALLAAELALQWYVSRIAQQGKLFEPDPEVGWRVLPDLDLVRRNANGNPWRVRTDEDGARRPRSFDSGARRRVLILGDSYAFGEGVDVEERLDHRLAAARPDWSVVDLGVMGYGTDQQLVGARAKQRELRHGDHLVLLTYSNDLFDILRRRFTGRAKPWFELRGGALVAHPPAIGVREWLRDRSYLASRLFLLFEKQRKFDDADLTRATALYGAIVLRETAAARAAGVHLTVAHHGHAALRSESARRAFERALHTVCTKPKVACLPLDPILGPRRSLRFLRDGHWSPEGHRVAAVALRGHLERLEGSAGAPTAGAREGL